MIIPPGASADLVDGRAPEGVTLEIYVPPDPDPPALQPSSFHPPAFHRELIYAARFLPRWRYAPMGVLRSWYG